MYRDVVAGQQGEEAQGLGGLLARTVGDLEQVEVVAGAVVHLANQANTNLIETGESEDWQGVWSHHGGLSEGRCEQARAADTNRENEHAEAPNEHAKQRNRETKMGNGEAKQNCTDDDGPGRWWCS